MAKKLTGKELLHKAMMPKHRKAMSSPLARMGAASRGQMAPTGMQLMNRLNTMSHASKMGTTRMKTHKAKRKTHKKNWIAGAIKKPGALHRQLGVAQGKKIPEKKLAVAANKGGKLGQRARLAETLKGFHAKAAHHKMMHEKTGKAHHAKMHKHYKAMIEKHKTHGKHMKHHKMHPVIKGEKDPYEKYEHDVQGQTEKYKRKHHKTACKKAHKHSKACM